MNLLKIIPGLSLSFQHIKEQPGKSSRSESGHSAPSCDFVTNLHNNCWVYFPLVLAACKTGFIFLLLGLFKEHTLEGPLLKGSFAILSPRVVFQSPDVSLQTLQQPIACHSLSFFISSMINGLTTT